MILYFSGVVREYIYMQYVQYAWYSDFVLVEGSCRWKLSSGNLYTFIGPNQEQLRKMQLYRSLAGIEPVALR